ncbi:MAG TPA: permease-like cell division protein FtsX [Candidatus Paceibacterota bacterium]|nr:permease-like cell division protein FtsX [Candidatus Paceibacterota bacterium]
MGMWWMTVKRVAGAGWKNFTRGGAVSVATVLIMTVTLSIIGSLIFLSALLNFTLGVIRDKVDVAVYFVTTASESEIFALRDKLTALPQVESISYTSREEAYDNFRTRHANDQLTLQALDELGVNPLDASLEVKAKDPSEYESIVSFLDATPALSADGTRIVDRVNYQQNKDAIDRLSLAIRATKDIGLIVVLLFAMASILIAFATIRLAIFTAKDEIVVMQLVGASKAYVRGPFVVAGIITGILAALFVLLILYPASWYTSVRTASWLGGFSPFAYYRDHFAFIFCTLVGSGIVLGGMASLLAIRRYLKA